MRAAVPLARLRVAFLELSGIAMQWHALRSARKAHGIQKTLVLITLGWVASDRDTPGLAQRKKRYTKPSGLPIPTRDLRAFASVTRLTIPKEIPTSPQWPMPWIFCVPGYFVLSASRFAHGPDVPEQPDTVLSSP